MANEQNSNPGPPFASLRELQWESFVVNVKNGWWAPHFDREERMTWDVMRAYLMAHPLKLSPMDVLARLMLVTTEVAEAAEDVRVGHMADLREVGDGTGPSKPVGFPSELADIVIRVFDLASSLGIDLESVITEKLAYNARRGVRHGGKLA